MKRMCKLIVYLSFLFIAACGSNFPNSYSAAPLIGTIVDIETGEPIPSAHVVAAYVLALPNASNINLHYEETQSDGIGEFRFAGFVDKNVPVSKVSGKIYSMPLEDDPVLHVFADGYLPGLFKKPFGSSEIWRKSHRVSPLNGNILAMTPLMNVALGKQADALDLSLMDMKNNLGTTCALYNMPMTLEFILSEIKRMQLSGVARSFSRMQGPDICESYNLE